MRSIVLLALLMLTACASSSSVVPIFWDSIELKSEDRGGAFVRAELGKDQQLAKLDVEIGDKNMEIPDSCLAGLNYPFLNGVKLVYGQWDSGEGYWQLSIPFDGTDSVELGSEMLLLFSNKEFLSSYKTIQIEIEREVWQDFEICN